MTPLRLFTLAILLYILYRLLFKKRYVSKSRNNTSRGMDKVQLRDVLVEDPVCHTYVPKQNAVMLQHGNEIIYFCSDKCYEAFLSKKGAE